MAKRVRKKPIRRTEGQLDLMHGHIPGVVNLAHFRAEKETREHRAAAEKQFAERQAREARANESLVTLISDTIDVGRALHDAGAFDRAERCYRAAVLLDPALAVGWFNLGVVLEDVGNYREAATAYQRALEADPDFADAHFNLSKLCDRKGDEMGQIRHFNDYRRLTGKSD